MNNDRVEKAALTVIFVVIALVVGLIGLGGWAVIELINWITSK